MNQQSKDQPYDLRKRLPQQYVKISTFIRSHNRIIITIYKQIDAIQRFFRRCCQYIGFICCNKSADLMAIIPACSDSRTASRLASAMYHGKWGVPAPGYAFLKCCLQKKAPSDCKHRRCDTTALVRIILKPF